MASEDANRKAPDGHTLLTGATGLLGRYLLHDLLKAGKAVAVLVRPSARRTPQERVGALVAHWERKGDSPLPRPVVLSGDVGEAALGLEPHARTWIGDHCTRVVHGAAVVRFHAASRSGEPWRTNERGARAILTLCKQLGIGDLHHISTAYVSGDREGRVLETDLDGGQSFRNDYEESKFLSEQAVRAADDIPHRTVIRPGVIAGATTDGATSAYHGLYVYLRALSVLLPRLRPDTRGVRQIPYAADLPLHAPRNIVPVDWVSRVILRLLETPAARGRTYHLTPEDPVTNGDLLSYAGTYYGDGPVELVAPSRWQRTIPHLSHALRMLRGYEGYGGGDALYDTTHRQQVAGDLPCPPIDEATIHRYLAYAERDRWGRRRAAD